MDIAGKVFIVTGGASGLGEGTARMLAANGAKVVIADLQVERGEAVAEIGGPSSSATSARKPTARPWWPQATAAGKLMGLVNCAGIAPACQDRGQGRRASLALYTKTIMVNLVGSFNMIRLAAEAMCKNEPEPTGERGVLISTASVAAYDGQIGQAAYRQQGRRGRHDAADRARPGAQRHPQHDHRAGHLRHADAVRHAAGGAGRAGRQRALPQPAGHGPQDYAKLVHQIITNDMLNGEVIRLDGAIRWRRSQLGV
jgi:nucleoside-diphosphate-sugar epimerase